MKMCEDHGLLVRIKNGIIYCWYCMEEIPLNKLKKRRGKDGKPKR